MSDLVIENLRAAYVRAQVLHDISLHLPSGKVGVVLGANGAGKTTLLRAISGLMQQTRGKARYGELNLLSSDPGEILRGGVAHVPQGRGTFPELTVEENLEVGGLSRPKTEVRVEIERTYERFPRLSERRKQAAGSLSGGEQQMLAISRALMTKPSLLLLDEPSLGLAPIITEQLFELLAQLHSDSGIGMLFVEQNADLALEIAHFVFVLETGSLVASGPSSDFMDSDAIKSAYLGVKTQ